MQDKIRHIAREFFKSRDAAVFIGYESSEEGSATRPCFLTKPEEVNRLVWTPLCVHNLARYLRNFRTFKGTVGILLKGCDARAIRELIRQNQIQRDRLFLVGISCGGMISPIVANNTEHISNGGNVFVISSGKKTIRIPKLKSLNKRCFNCQYPDDFQYDKTIGNMKPPAWASQKNVKNKYIEKWSSKERFIFWQKEFEKCISCYACRQTCYGCFCTQCIIDLQKPRWSSGQHKISDKYFYHIIRVIHSATKCIECGECERACPVGIPLLDLMKSINKDIKKLFGYEGAGISKDKKPALIEFSLKDADPFV